MIRDARFSDIPALTKLLRWAHRTSKYATRTQLHDKSIEELLLGLIAGQKQNGPGATYLKVICHDETGEVVGFMAGMLNRVYNIATKLAASDLFLINTNGAYRADMLGLIDGYVEWAKSNPKVIEIGLSWSDAITDGQSLARLYRRKGFKLVGEQYELRTDDALEEAA